MTLYRVGLACIAFAAVPLCLQAQTMGGGGSFGGSSSGIGGASGSFGSSGGGSSGGSFGGGSSTGAGGFLGTSGSAGVGAGSGFLTTPGPGQLGQALSAGVKTTTSADLFAPYYVNPLAIGNVVPGANTAITQFGLPLYNSLYPGSQITSIFSSTTANTASTRSVPPLTNVSPNNFGVVGYKAPPTYITSLGFNYTPPAPPQMKESAQAVLSRSSSLPKDLRVSMDGATVVLQGKVTDASQRRLAENLVKLTPGIGPVRNELQVAAPAKSGQ
jgi:hypothetical protein